jgi:hypothetical protein
MDASRHMHSTYLSSHLRLFLNSHNISSQVQFMKLTLRQFHKFPIIFSHKVYKLISTVPKHSLQSFLCITDQVSHQQLKQYYVRVNIFILRWLVFRKETKQSCSQFLQVHLSQFLYNPTFFAKCHS